MVTAGVQSSRVATSIGTENLERLSAVKRKDVAIVLKKSDRFTCNSSCSDVMVALDIDVLVDNSRRREQSTRVKFTCSVLGVGGKVGQGVILILTELEPRSDNPRHLHVLLE